MAAEQGCQVPAGATLIPFPGVAPTKMSVPGTLKSATLELRGDNLSFAFEAEQGTLGQSDSAYSSSSGSTLGTREPPG